MNQVRIGLLILAILGICGEFVFVIDYNDLSWSNNAGSYLTIMSMVLLVVSMIISIQHVKKETGKKSILFLKKHILSK
ncbi:MAG: hypothetical protein LWX70_16230 [Sphingobacteriia bacterium]|nr:hypothetical protein [Sphingobacteriia bacterium]